MGVIGTPLNSKNLKPSWELQANEEIIRAGKHGKIFEDDALRMYGDSSASKGWTPASFKSQRSQRADTVTKDARSLMDARDFAEASQASMLTILPVYDQILLEVGRKIVNRLTGKRLINERHGVSYIEVPRAPLKVIMSKNTIGRLACIFRSAGSAGSDDFITSLPVLPLNYQPTGISSQKTHHIESHEPVPKAIRNISHDIDIDDRLTSQQATQALSGFMPFKNIPVKHDAYISYLKYYAGQVTSCRLDSRDPLNLRKITAPVPDLKNVEQKPLRSMAVRESFWRPASLLCRRFSVDAPPDAPAPTKVSEVADTGSVVSVPPTIDRAKCKSVFSTTSDDKIPSSSAEQKPTLGTKRSLRPRASDFMHVPGWMLSQLRRSVLGRVPHRLLSDIRYTKNHEWVRKNDITGQVRVGITDYAQKALGDLVFLELPRPGSKVSQNDVLGIAESVKGASDIYSPIGGTVIDVNSSVLSKPSIINKSPESEGWLCTVLVDDPSELQDLLDPSAYKNFCENEAS